MFTKEVGSVQLVDAQRVVDQTGPLRRVGDQRGLRVQVALPGDLAARGQFAAYAQTRRDLRALFPRRFEQRVHGAGRQHVVAVQEHHVRGARRVDPIVPGAPAAAAVLRAAYDLHARLIGGEAVEEVGAAVGRAVVDGERLQDGRALSECRTHRVRHVGGVVVTDDDDADLRVVRFHRIHGPKS